MILGNILIYIVSFILVWVGAGLIISSIDKLSKRLKLSSFAVSFFILGTLTSIPEISVGLTALSENTPEIFVGDLIGGVAVIFFLIIPILAIFGNGIRLSNKLDTKALLFSFLVMLSPVFAVMDKKVTNLEGVILIGLYGFLFYFIEKDHGILDGNKKILHLQAYSLLDLLKTILGVFLVFIASGFIVEETMYFAENFGISTFFISLVVLSLGTNLPELSLAVRALVSGKKDIAFGDYVGSATANTAIFGLLTVLSNGEVLTVNNFFKTLMVISLGFCLFFYFSRSKNDLSRKEGIILLLVYLAFLLPVF